MRAHNITLLMACFFTITAATVHAAGAHIILVGFLAADAVASLILSALYAPEENHR